MVENTAPSYDFILARTESGEHCTLESFLETISNKRKSMAVLSSDPAVVAAIESIVTGFGFELLLLNTEDMLHIQKRRLNKAKTGFILYSGECKDTVWELFNDGSTLLEDSFEIISTPARMTNF